MGQLMVRRRNLWNDKWRVNQFDFLLFILAVFWPAFKKQARKDRGRNIDSYKDILHIIVATIIPVLLSMTLYNLSGLLEDYL